MLLALGELSRERHKVLKGVAGRRWERYPLREIGTNADPDARSRPATVLSRHRSESFLIL